MRACAQLRQTKVETELQTIRNNIETLVNTLCPASTASTASPAGSEDETDSSEISKKAETLLPPAGSAQRDAKAPFAAIVRLPSTLPFLLKSAHTMPRLP